MSTENPLKLKLFIVDGTIPNFDGALCAEEGIDPESWFVDDAMTSRVAKSYCYLCPFGPGPNGDDVCFNWAIEVEAQTGYFAYGIFGGRDAAYRQRLLDRRKYLDENDEAPRSDEYWGQRNG